jgi:hypothetical protein
MTLKRQLQVSLTVFGDVLDYGQYRIHFLPTSHQYKVVLDFGGSKSQYVYIPSYPLNISNYEDIELP